MGQSSVGWIQLDDELVLRGSFDRGPDGVLRKDFAGAVGPGDPQSVMRVSFSTDADPGDHVMTGPRHLETEVRRLGSVRVRLAVEALQADLAAGPDLEDQTLAGLRQLRRLDRVTPGTIGGGRG